MQFKKLNFDPGTYSDLFETPDGHRLWEFLLERETWIRMETATYLGRPAVEAIQRQLLKNFPDVIRKDRWKQMTGRMVRQIMEYRRHPLEQTGVRLKRNDLFSSAARYRYRKPVHQIHAEEEWAKMGGKNESN